MKPAPWMRLMSQFREPSKASRESESTVMASPSSWIRKMLRAWRAKKTSPWPETRIMAPPSLVMAFLRNLPREPEPSWVKVICP